MLGIPHLRIRNISKLTALAGLIALFTGSIRAEDSGPDKPLNDPFLEKMIGDWKVERTFRSGRKSSNTVHAEWVLQHHFVELHYRDVASPPHYEAIVLIGYDGTANRYIAHWSDVFGGSYSADGFAPRDEKSDAVEFSFTFHDGPLTNRYAFDAQSSTWTSTIRQSEKGEWKLFCEDKFTRIGGKEAPHQ